MLTNSVIQRNIIPTPTKQCHLKYIVYILVMLFGLGTWTNLAGLWVQLPIIVSILPESWYLPAKLTLVINVANIFPILFAFASIIFKLNTSRFESPINFILLLTSITLAIGFANFWNTTAYIFDTKQSVFLICLCFITATADCLSSVTFIPFLHRYESLYLNAYFTGEALTALLPALLGIIQGIGKSQCSILDIQMNETFVQMQYSPRFSVRTYFLILSSLPLVALVSFACLHLTKTGRTEKKRTVKRCKYHQSRIFIMMDNIEDMTVIQSTIKIINKIEDQLENRKYKSQLKAVVTPELVKYLILVFQQSFLLYGICPGLTAFSLNAYSATTFHYTIIASSFAYPLMTLIGAFIPKVSSKTIAMLCIIYTGLFVYIFITAKLSPCPPLVNAILGHAIIFFVWIFMNLSGSYMRILLGNYFKDTADHRGLIWFGLATQTGSLVGSFIMFILMNSFQLFKEGSICGKASQCF